MKKIFLFSKKLQVFSLKVCIFLKIFIFLNPLFIGIEATSLTTKTPQKKTKKYPVFFLKTQD